MAILTLWKLSWTLWTLSLIVYLVHLSVRKSTKSLCPLFLSNQLTWLLLLACLVFSSSSCRSGIFHHSESKLFIFLLKCFKPLRNLNKVSSFVCADKIWIFFSFSFNSMLSQLVKNVSLTLVSWISVSIDFIMKCPLLLLARSTFFSLFMMRLLSRNISWQSHLSR